MESMTLTKQDTAIIRELAAEVAEIAALPVQEEKRALWRGLNALEPLRPMVSAVSERADITIENEGSIDDFHQAIEEQLVGAVLPLQRESRA